MRITQTIDHNNHSVLPSIQLIVLSSDRSAQCLNGCRMHWYGRYGGLYHYFEMNQNLLQQTLYQADTYDPFKNPPDLSLARTHRQACMVGTYESKNKPQFCPCCDHIVNKSPLPVAFSDEDVLNLGVGYPLYYKLSRYFFLILLGIFFISGSAMYFLMTLRCEGNQTCLTIFGIPVINTSMMEQHNLNSTEIVNTVTAIIIFMIVLYLKTVTNDDILHLTAKKNCPSLYTVMLQNLPKVGDQELAQWIQQRFGEKPEEINWAYDVQEFAKAYKEKHAALIQSNKIRIRLEQYKKYQTDTANSRILTEVRKDEKTETSLAHELTRLQLDIQRCEQILEKYNSEDKECEKVGTVFVSFQRVETVNTIIDEYQCSFFNSFIKSVFVWVKKSRLFFKNKVIVVNKAPAPKEIIWENLRFSYIRSLIFEVIFIVVMALMLGGALKVIILFLNYALTFRIQGQKQGKFWLLAKGIAISLLVVIINCLMRLVIQAFTYAKRYYSYTKYQGSFILYYSIFYILNSCCIVYIVHQKDVQDNKQLLLTDIHMVMLANAFSEPLFKLFDPVMLFRIVRRWYIKRLRPAQNPYTQQYVNKAWQGHEINNGDNYQYITRVLFITTWFSTVAPVGVFFSLVGLISDYWISRWLLVRYYKIPENISEDIAKPTLMGLELLPLVYILGILQFNYKVSTSQSILDFFTDFFNYGVTTLLLLLSITGYIIFCKQSPMVQISRRYKQAKIGFRYNYGSTNPITKLKGDIDYLYEVLKQNQNQEDHDRIDKLLKLSRVSPSKLGEHREELFLIRMEMEKKASVANQEVEMVQRTNDVWRGQND